MLFAASLPPASLAQVPQIADAAERIGFDALWAAETQHDPFLPLALAAEHTERLHLGTAIAVGFARSPPPPAPPAPRESWGGRAGPPRAFWRCWQPGEPLSFRGEHFRLSLMTPFFNPGPIDHPEIPIYLAGVNTALCRLAGEIADGLHAHPYHSEGYLREVVEPAVTAGAAQAGRSRADGRDSREAARA